MDPTHHLFRSHGAGPSSGDALGQRMAPVIRPEVRPDAAMVFRIAVGWWALEARVLLEIIETRPIRSLPHRRQGVLLGLANVRGELLTCMSLRLALGLESSECEPASLPDTIKRGCGRIMVLCRQDERYAVPVDEVHGVERFQIPSFGDPTGITPENAPPIIQRTVCWRGRSVALLDTARLFDLLRRSLG